MKRIKPIKINLKIKEKGKGVKKALEEIKKAVESDVLVGVPATAKERKGDELTEALLMYWHSEGAPANNLPPRPVIQMAIKQNQKEIEKQIKEVIKLALDGNVAGAKSKQHLLGAFVVEKIDAIFGSTELAPLKPATIKRKKSNLPLIDTGQLRRSIAYKIEKAKK